jgi:hypothetical protein
MDFISIYLCRSIPQKCPTNCKLEAEESMGVLKSGKKAFKLGMKLVLQPSKSR